MSRKIFQKILLLLLLPLLIFISKSDTYAQSTYDCTRWGMYCQLPGGIINGFWYEWYWGGCRRYPDSGGWTWRCTGTDSDCTESRYRTYYSSEDDCLAGRDPKGTGCCGSTPTIPPCNDCTLGSCPAPLTETGLEEFKLLNYRVCQRTGSCAGPKYGDCYENKTGSDPTASIQVFPDGVASTLGCVSNTYSSTYVNNRVNMVGTYTDADGGTDIEAIYVWFKTDITTPNTPKYIDLNNDSGQTGRTYTSNSFGFMMHKEGGNWVAYVPSLVGGGSDKWVRASMSGSNFDILGPSGSALIRIENPVTNISGNNVTLNFYAHFGPSAASDGLYNIFVMANDVFGFTPYDNYGPGVTKMGDYFDEEEIRYHQVWSDSSRDWGLDKISPTISYLNTEVTAPTKIKFSWEAGDLRNIYGIVGNLYRSDGVVNFESVRDVTLTSLGTKTVNTPYLPEELGENVVGHLNNEFFVRAMTPGSVNLTGEVEMNVGSNREGSIIYYVTAFDIACNPGALYSTYDLEDWIITYGGLLYSSTGIEFYVKNVDDPNLWNPVLLLNKISPLFADISSELYGNALSFPSPLEKSVQNKSFSVSPFVAYKSFDFYNDLRRSYERRELGLPSSVSRLNPSISTLTGYLSGYGSGSVKVLNRVGDLTIGDTNAFYCDQKGLFFVSGDLIVNHEILNSDRNSDACIFVVDGDMIINPGPDSTNGAIGTLGYDELNGYFLVNGSVTINEDPFYNGLYINGGIQSLGGIDMNRYLGLDHRSLYPLFFVENSSKYGYTSSELIGDQIDIVKVEPGYKPY